MFAKVTAKMLVVFVVRHSVEREKEGLKDDMQ